MRLEEGLDELVDGVEVGMVDLFVDGGFMVDEQDDPTPLPCCPSFFYLLPQIYEFPSQHITVQVCNNR